MASLDETSGLQGCLSQQIVRGTNVPSRTEGRRVEVWRAIERYAANPTLPVSRNLLCRETGVSARMLHDVCRAFSGQSPIAYIKRCHMTLAHTMLHRAAPDATVTGIATLCGFCSLGYFAVRYRQRYGESPSQTLRQHPSRL